MTKVKMKALDTIHVTSVGSESLAAGEAFEVSEAEAKQLEASKLAARAPSKSSKKA